MLSSAPRAVPITLTKMRGIFEVPANLHPRHSHKPQPRVFQLALYQVTDNMLYCFRNLYMPCIHTLNSLLHRECWVR